MVDERAPVSVACSNPVWLASFRIHRRCTTKNQVGRVFLCGDASHIHSPAGGQGMNTGIQDAYNLAWKLALVAKRLAPSVLVESYQDERHPVAESLIKMTDAMTRFGTLKSHLGIELRNRVAGALAEMEVIQHRLAPRIAELNINYRQSPIVAEHLGGGLFQRLTQGAFAVGPRAGDRAPDAGPVIREDGTIAQLFDVLRGPEHVLLLFGGTQTNWGEAASAWGRLGEAADAVRARYGSSIRVYRVPPAGTPPGGDAHQGILLDPDHALHDRYGARTECLYLIRPDGYVGFRSEPVEPEALFDYLGRVLVTGSGGEGESKP
jgi:hypothetical protein